MCTFRAKLAVESALLEGREVLSLPDGSLDLYLLGPPERGFDLVLTTRSTAPLPVHVVAQLPGWPSALAATLPPRPADRMPRYTRDLLTASDMTLVSTTLAL